MRKQALIQIFAIPVLVALTSAIGLIAALVSDGVWDALSWLMLAIPVAVCVYFPVWRPMPKTAKGGRLNRKKA